MKKTLHLPKYAKWSCISIGFSNFDTAPTKSISTTIDIFLNGDYKTIYFLTGNNCFMIAKIISNEPHDSLHAGGIGICIE